MRSNSTVALFCFDPLTTLLQRFDNKGFSIWRVDFKYPEELTQVYMSSNQIGGFFSEYQLAYLTSHRPSLAYPSQSELHRHSRPLGRFSQTPLRLRGCPR